MTFLIIFLNRVRFAKFLFPFFFFLFFTSRVAVVLAMSRA